MKQELGEQSPFKLWVAEGEGSYFRDGPVPELLKIYSEDRNTSLEPSAPSSVDLEKRVTEALANLFPGRKILPHHLPSFLQETCTLRTRDDKSVDLDVNVAAFTSALHARAYELLGNDNKRDLEEARTCLLSQIILDPCSTVGFYNLACAESLLHHTDAAIIALQKSVELGFSNVDHITSDEDLKNIRSDPRFTEIISTLRPPIERDIEIQTRETEVKPHPQSYQPDMKKWQKELHLLAEMGFFDESILVQILDKTGNVPETLSELLG